MAKDRFVEWMAAETAYSTSKFPDEEQYPYWEEGVARGDFSFKVSIINYLTRAGLFASIIDENDTRAGLQLAQSLGKATHNLITLAAVSRTYYTREEIAVVHADLSTSFQIDLDEAVTCDRPHIVQAIESTSEALDALQIKQDDDLLDEFTSILAGQIITAGSLFVSAAQAYTYPKPGLSSGNIERWD